MRSFGSALVAATLLFAGSIVAFPTANNAAVIGTLPEALELLGDKTIWEKRAVIVGTRAGTGLQESLCKLDKARVPVGDGTTKLTGAGSMKLKLVVIGHGTQNYTCADSTANSKPVANGAHADLYDASCFASYFPSIIDWFPYLFLHKPRAIPIENLPKVGVHYFHPDASTPVFDVETIATSKRGLFVGKKLENIPAPGDANTGVAPDAFGAVDWLKLVNKADVRTASGEVLASKGYQAVYRVQTAGGKAPATCKGRPKKFEVVYATQYWLYN